VSNTLAPGLTTLTLKNGLKPECRGGKIPFGFDRGVSIQASIILTVLHMKVLGISTSPRIQSNSDMLLRRALAGAESAGAKTVYVRLSDYTVGPCLACNACLATGYCRVADDYPQLLNDIIEADRLVFATPVFFMSVCAQAKMLIDRGQCLWAYTHIAKKQLFTPERDRRAMVIAVAGSKSKKQFESIRLTMRSYFDAIQMNYTFNLFVSEVDAPGEIEKHPLALEEAHRLGRQLIAADTPGSEGLIDVQIT
jgi:multimeric flavodoxin WrbA